MKIILENADAEQYIVARDSVELPDDPQEVNADVLVRIVEAVKTDAGYVGIAYPTQALTAVLGRGRWEYYRGSDELLDEIFAGDMQVEPNDPELLPPHADLDDALTLS